MLVNMDVVKTTTYSSIRPLFYFSRIFGLAPFSIKSKVLSKPATVYTFLLLLLIVAGTSRMLHRMFLNENLTRLVKFVTFVRVVSPAITTLISCFVIFFKYTKFIDTFTDICHIEYIIDNILCELLPYKKYKQFQVFQIFLLVIVISNHLIMFFYVSDVDVIYYLPMTMNMILQNQFICSVLLLKQYFSILNKKLYQLGNFMNDPLLPAYLTPACNLNYKKTGLIYVNPYTKSTKNLIIIIMELHRSLCIICEKVNSFFSFAILLTIGSDMLNTTFNLYMLFKNFSLTYDLSIFLSLYTALWSIIQVGIIAFVCDSAGCEVRTYNLMLLVPLNYIMLICIDVL